MLNWSACNNLVVGSIIYCDVPGSPCLSKKGESSIPGPVSYRCLSGLLETPPRWHATICISVKHFSWTAYNTTAGFLGYSGLPTPLCGRGREGRMEEKGREGDGRVGRGKSTLLVVGFLGLMTHRCVPMCVGGGSGWKKREAWSKGPKDVCISFPR